MKKSYTIKIPVGLFWKVYVPAAVILAIVGTLVGILIIDRIVMVHVVGVNRGTVEVPSVEGMTWDEGREKLYAIGLIGEIRAREYNDTIGENGIIDQSPATGSKVKKGRRIALIVSKGKEIAIVPDLSNLTERQASIELKKRGFTIGNVKRRYSYLAADKVVEVFPKSGTTISREMEVDLVVSKGPRPTHATVPNVIGESISEAKKRIEESGLLVGSIEHEHNSSLLPGTVISQSVTPGSNVALESTVNIVVSVVQ